jgi:hypothetical protein
MPSHVIVTPDSAVSAVELKRKLLDLAASQGMDYGVIVKRLSGVRQSTQVEPFVVMTAMSDGGDAPRVQSLAAFKVYADGREEPMRGADITGLSAASFRSIVAASQERAVHTTLFRSGASPFAGGGSGAVTYLMPSLLFPNVSLRRLRDGYPRPPLVPRPPLSPR